jgi:hypothetical protein
MVDSGLCARQGRVNRAAGPVFDHVAAKLLRPSVWPGTIHWSLLIERPDDGDACLVASVVQQQARVRP